MIEHYKAASSAAAVVREDWMGILKLTGPERQSWLQAMVTNEVVKLSPGQGCYAGHLNPQGKLLAQFLILVADEEVLLLVERVNVEKLLTGFDKLIIMEDVRVEDVTNEHDIFGVVGPQSKAILERWTGQSLPDRAILYNHRLFSQGRVFSSDLGYGVIVPRSTSPEALRSVCAAGAVEIGYDTWNVLRTEEGLPLYGVDIDETTTLPELGQRGIDYDKGCYIGQEVVARIKYIGHVNRHFVGFVCEGSRLPESRSLVQMEGKDVGYVTTAVFSPRLGRSIALGFVNRVAAAPGKSVILIGKESSLSARVASLPFA